MYVTRSEAPDRSCRPSASDLLTGVIALPAPALSIGSIDRSIHVDPRRPIRGLLPSLCSNPNPAYDQPTHATPSSAAAAAAAAAATGEGGAARLPIAGAGDDEGDSFVRLLSEHWEDVFAGVGEEGEDGGSVTMLSPEEIVARIDEAKRGRTRRCVICVCVGARERERGLGMGFWGGRVCG